MGASRLITLVLLLQARGTVTAAELARELEVSERTVDRDVLALSAAGLPVHAEQGRAGSARPACAGCGTSPSPWPSVRPPKRPAIRTRTVDRYR